MSKKGQSKNDLKNLTYIPQKPAFLQNFGQPKRPSPPPGRSGAKREGRGDLPSRPSEAMPKRRMGVMMNGEKRLGEEEMKDLR
jgi:hypothetical protein